MVRIMQGRRGQVTVEMAVLFGFVVAGLIAMSIYFQRGVQGGVKSNADSIGTQFSSKDGWNARSRSASEDTAGRTISGQYSNACQGLSGAALNKCLGANQASIQASLGNPKLNIGTPDLKDLRADPDLMRATTGS